MFFCFAYVKKKYLSLRFHQPSFEKPERFLIAADERADQYDGDESTFADAVDLPADYQRQRNGQDDQRCVKADFQFAEIHFPTRGNRFY